MEFFVAQLLTGLANASSLFLVACGLSLIFGVTRIVNFAHGSLYMIGAYIGYSLMQILPGGFGFWGAIDPSDPGSGPVDLGCRRLARSKGAWPSGRLPHYG